MPRTASDRTALIRLAASLPKGSEERRALLADLNKKARKRSLTITVDEDRDRDGQPYVEFNGEDRYYQVKPGEWRNPYGRMPASELSKIADHLLAGKL